MGHSLVIVNPHASRMADPATREAVIAAVDEALRRRDGRAPDIAVPEDAAQTRTLVREAVAAGVAAVVGVGGDGTLKELAAVLAGTGVPLGMVPGGTGNILAGVLGVPGSPLDAALALADAAPRTIDLGDVTVELAGPVGSDGHVPVPTIERMTFMVGVGIGFDARVMATTPPDLKRRLGRVAYFAQAAWLATQLAAVPYRVTVDGERFETDASIALVTNVAEQVPGVLRTRLPVVPDDGLLDVFVLGAAGPIQGVRGLLDHLVRTDLGQGAGGGTIRVRGRHVRLESTPPEPVQVDGDHLGDGALEAVVRPAALTVLTERGLPGSGSQASPGADG